MRDRVRVISKTGALVLVLQLLMAGIASAHSLTLAAEAVCVGITPTINFKVTSWSDRTRGDQSAGRGQFQQRGGVHRCLGRSQWKRHCGIIAVPRRRLCRGVGDRRHSVALGRGRWTDLRDDRDHSR